MGRIGVYIERYTITRSDEMEALMRFAMVARKIGHEVDYLFRPDVAKIPQYDAIFIRALTDPLNTSYVAARMAEMHGKRVIDDPRSIYICCDKVNMYAHLQREGVPMPDTLFLEEKDLTRARAAQVFEQLGSPVVLKAPNSSFSMYVEKAETPEAFVRVGNRFLRRSDRLVAQRFIKSDFDWRVGIVAGEVLYVCQYTIPRKRWKILTYAENNRAISGPVKGVPIEKADPQLLEVALAAARAIGDGLYGIDLKQVDDGYAVIEVNDNPTINAGEEDQAAGDLYEKVIRFLVEGKTTP
ncbi:MAG TPA: RimK family alpha-L-glutamate ligase [candidate division Zixibacteria bacterium]|nr:RimK family alpha-L-glutamate ligase [candidate division Zixibacteria bacterium]MDD4916309.1 RimK family alpha-L-glutamate ligase [candidate division Zixibacteria bacterium]MDM7973435.1 RimK family alpha-L-glutamate ligase [candidate division Zixibacteria bacterium]HOD65710.1 RimK family alpha-L-glutamate ligase [candidate division Zixibacteria bacterium]HOZ07166.1 RimK family alpha-L-glutamate ligase [candidate division Zixibacteria bacterium]